MVVLAGDQEHLGTTYRPGDMSDSSEDELELVSAYNRETDEDDDNYIDMTPIRTLNT